MDARQRIVSALTHDAALRRQGLELVIEHILGTRVDAWLDVQTVSAFLTQALSSENSARTAERHLVPALARVHAQLRASAERVGDAVPEPARAELERLVANPRGPRFAWLQGALDRDKLRALIAPAIQEIFLGFIARVVPGNGTGPAGAVSVAAGLVGKLGRGTGERLRNLGKSVADGLGVDIEARLREVAKDYSQGATVAFGEAVRTRLATPEAASTIADLSRGVLEHVLATPLSVVLDDLDRLPLADAIRAGAAITSHAVARDVWRSVLEQEVRAALALEGARTLRELLAEAGLLELLRAKILERGEPVLQSLFASDAFANWLDSLLRDEP